ncbi:MAG: hypothetical protein HC846_04875 [Blastocatellia bacterium]|nr:hypothetical protein [Blastocatellia bacterium]
MQYIVFHPIDVSEYYEVKTDSARRIMQNSLYHRRKVDFVRQIYKNKFQSGNKRDFLSFE